MAAVRFLLARCAANKSGSVEFHGAVAPEPPKEALDIGKALRPVRPPMPRVHVPRVEVAPSLPMGSYAASPSRTAIAAIRRRAYRSSPARLHCIEEAEDEEEENDLDYPAQVGRAMSRSWQEERKAPAAPSRSWFRPATVGSSPMTVTDVKMVLAEDTLRQDGQHIGRLRPDFRMLRGASRIDAARR
mmetsp:Transcript_129601/g.375355  ORF Transcript_129601/g.375355 Transcript_129601/m.375355 type:complete len:187 (-) Transcript_129601:25-585(-)